MKMCRILNTLALELGKQKYSERYKIFDSDEEIYKREQKRKIAEKFTEKIKIVSTRNEKLPFPCSCTVVVKIGEKCRSDAKIPSKRKFTEECQTREK